MLDLGVRKRSGEECAGEKRCCYEGEVCFLFFCFFSSFFFLRPLTLRSPRRFPLSRAKSLRAFLLPSSSCPFALASSYGLASVRATRPRERQNPRRTKNTTRTMKLAAPLLVAVAAIALSALSSPASASIHSYNNDYFYSVGDAYIFRGGREGLYASTKEVIYFGRERGGREGRGRGNEDARRRRRRRRRLVGHKKNSLLARGKPFRSCFFDPVFILVKRKRDPFAILGQRLAFFIAAKSLASDVHCSRLTSFVFFKVFPSGR